jgi:hypothetical protein
MTAISLLEAAKLAADGGDTKKAGVISLYAQQSDILAAMKFEGISGNAVTFTQDGDLPTTAFRGVNEAYTPNNGTFANQTESLYIAGGDLDVDTFIVKTMGMEVRSRHEANKVKALSVGTTNQIITGDNSSAPRGFDGLQKRCTGTQLVSNGNTSGGDPLSLATLDQAIDQTDGATHIIMNRTLRRLFYKAFRSSTFPNGLFTMDGSSDSGQGFKRTLRYGELPVLVGYEQNKNTALLGFTEAGAGGGTTSSSIYVVNFSDSGIVGISNGGISVRDMGELQTAPVWRTRVEWFLGMASYNPFAATRLYGISNASIAA